MSLITIKAPVTEKRPLPTNPCYCKTSLGQTIEKLSSTLDSQINTTPKILVKISVPYETFNLTLKITSTFP